MFEFLVYLKSKFINMSTEIQCIPIWERFSPKRENDPFMNLVKIKIEDEKASAETISINQSLLGLYVNGLIEVRMEDSTAPPFIRLTHDGGHIIYAEMAATYMAIAEA